MVAGAGCFFVDEIYVLLVMRALLGISVGFIMPLSTGLLAYYYPPEQQAQLMGLSAAMNQMGGVVATLLAGLLATIEWNYAFLVYLMGLIAVVMVWLWLPDEKLGSANKRGIMPLLSAALYLGQFVSPLVVMPLSHNLFGADLTAPYKVAILLCFVFLVQVWTTRHFQSLPPKQ